MKRQIRCAAAILSLLPAFAATNTGIIQVTGIRSWSHKDSTRIIVETSGPFEFKTDRAQNPNRFYIDIPNSRPWINQKRFVTHEIGDKLARKVRLAEPNPGTTRIVFDLVSDITFKVSRLATPDRMVIELRPAKVERVRFVYPAIQAVARRQIMMPAPPVLPLPAVLSPLTGLIPPLPGLIKRTPVVSGVTTKVLSPTRPTMSDATPRSSENATRSLTRALGLKVNTIVIDAGHGGHDEGTGGPHGVLEKDVVLDVSLRLARLLHDKLGTEVVLTRSDDNFIPLHERTAIANQHHADLFLSIHANSSPSPEVAGTESFFLNFSSSPGAIDVAARENAGSEKTVSELKDLIQTITLNDKIEESHTFAQNVQTALTAQALKTNVNSRNRGVKKAPFVVLIGASMPSVLAEIGFLSNSKDESNLNKPEYRQKIAEALYKGVSQYSQSLSHFEIARERKPGQTTVGVGQ